MIGIVKKKGSFSDYWIEYCEQNGIEYKIVDPYSSNIIDDLSNCSAFMWHHHHASYEDRLFANSLLFSQQLSGKSVFPDVKTTWFFDDKVAQKYLLESINAPLIKSFVFYNKKDALSWLSTANFPLIFKLKGGAGGDNVKMVHDYKHSKKIVKQAFGKGFSQRNRLLYLKERYRRYRDDIGSLKEVIKGIGRLIIPSPFDKMYHKEKGYVFFQEYIPNNSYDIRIIVTGRYAFGIKRMVRKNDFRASGSGFICYSKDEIDERCVKIAFNINQKIHAQSIAYDFIFDENNDPLIVEICYAYKPESYMNCEGFWDSDLKWHDETINIGKWQIEQCLSK